jgi:alpha-beta hydrolase superfamily lysophospholipase
VNLDSNFKQQTPELHMSENNGQHHEEFKVTRSIHMVVGILLVIIFLLVMKVTIFVTLIAALATGAYLFLFAHHLNHKIQIDFQSERRYNRESKDNLQRELCSHGADISHWMNKCHEMEKILENSEELSALHFMRRQDEGGKEIDFRAPDTQDQLEFSKRQKEKADINAAPV